MKPNVTAAFILVASVAGLLDSSAHAAEDTSVSPCPEPYVNGRTDRSSSLEFPSGEVSFTISGEHYSVPRRYLAAGPWIYSRDCLLPARFFVIRISVVDGSPLKPSLEGRALGTMAAKDPTGVLRSYIQISVTEPDDYHDPRRRYDNLQKYITPGFKKSKVGDYVIRENFDGSVIYIWKSDSISSALIDCSKSVCTGFVKFDNAPISLWLKFSREDALKYNSVEKVFLDLLSTWKSSRAPASNDSGK